MLFKVGDYNKRLVLIVSFPIDSPNPGVFFDELNI